MLAASFHEREPDHLVELSERFSFGPAYPGPHQESFHVGGRRPGNQVAWRGSLFDLSLPHDSDAIGWAEHFGRKALRELLEANEGES